jgi:amidophosphoribosyltransferase
MIIDEYNKTKDAIDAIQNTCQKLIGSYSFVAVINGVLYAVRDPLGMKPLSLGRSEDFVVLASETVAFDSLDIKYERSIEPGEILEINGKKETSHKMSTPDHTANCMFEYLYFARPDSIIFDKSVYEVRLNVGKRLAQDMMRKKIRSDMQQEIKQQKKNNEVVRESVAEKVQEKKKMM